MSNLVLPSLVQFTSIRIDYIVAVGKLQHAQGPLRSVKAEFDFFSMTFVNSNDEEDMPTTQ